MTDISCPHCGTSKAISHDKFLQLIGRTARCGSCRFEFQVQPQETATADVLQDVDPLDFLVPPVQRVSSENSTSPATAAEQNEKRQPTDSERRDGIAKVSRMIRQRRRDRRSSGGCFESVAKTIVLILAGLFVLGVAGAVAASSLPALGVIVAAQGMNLFVLWTISDQLSAVIQRLDDRDDEDDE